MGRLRYKQRQKRNDFHCWLLQISSRFVRLQTANREPLTTGIKYIKGCRIHISGSNYVTGAAICTSGGNQVLRFGHFFFTAANPFQF